MEEAVITSGYKILFDAGILGVIVIGLSVVIWKVVDAIWKLVLDLLARQRAVITVRDKTIKEKNETILVLYQKIAELESRKNKK